MELSQNYDKNPTRFRKIRRSLAAFVLASGSLLGISGCGNYDVYRKVQDMCQELEDSGTQLPPYGDRSGKVTVTFEEDPYGCTEGPTGEPDVYLIKRS